MPNDLLEVLESCADAVTEAIVGEQGRGFSGERPTQYHLDLAADRAALEVLHGAGLTVVSEESGRTGEGELVCVLDPIDGSTNCDRGIGFYALSACICDEQGPLLGLVRNLATAEQYDARRGEGSRKDGRSISCSDRTVLSSAIVAFSGLPPRHGGWAQFRAFGAASLEICMVAEGSIDAYGVAAASALHPWDYLAGMLILHEAGGVAIERDGAELYTHDAVRRRPIFANSSQLANQVAEAIV